MKYLKGINNLGWLNFVLGFITNGHYVRPYITPLITRKLNYAINRLKEIRTCDFTAAQKLKLITESLNAFDKGETSPPIPDVINDGKITKLPAQLCEKAPSTSSVESKEPIWNQSFTCQIFVQRDQDFSTFEEYYQTLVKKVEAHGFDKTKCHCLLFESTDGKTFLWITVEGMTQDIINTILPKFVGFYSFTQYNYEPHISPLMLKNAKPFRYNCVSVKNPASLFIHGDSSSDWDHS